jgi:hypothetical protein
VKRARRADVGLTRARVASRRAGAGMESSRCGACPVSAGRACTGLGRAGG